MKKTYLLFIWISSMLCQGMAGQEQITLPMCYDRAHDNYPDIRQYGLIEQARDYDLSNAAKGWLPQLSVNAKATYQSEVTKLPFDTEQLSSVLPGFDIPTLNKDQYQVTAQVDQTLWDGGIVRSARQLTEAETDVSRKQLESNLYSLRERINNLYFGTLLQEELVKQNSLLQKDLQDNISRLEAMMKNGTANQSDLDNMEVELLKAKQSEIELKASRTAYLRMLCLFIKVPFNEGITLRPPTLPGDRMPTEINRPELTWMDAKSHSLMVRDKQLTTGLMPHLSAFIQGGYGRPGLNMLENSFSPFYAAGVRLSWNMGKLYTLKNDRRKLENGRQTIGVQRETFLFNTRLQMEQQNTEIRKINDLIRSDNKIVQLRESVRKASEVKLANGIISVTDLIRDINAEDLARQSAATHQTQRLMAIYNYFYTTNNQ